MKFVEYCLSTSLERGGLPGQRDSPYYNAKSVSKSWQVLSTPRPDPNVTDLAIEYLGGHKYQGVVGEFLS